MRITEGTPTASEGGSLELEDIQSGALHGRPNPYVGRYLLLRIDDRAAGRELVRRLHPFVDSGRSAPARAQGAWITVAFSYRGLEALGVAAGLARELRAGVPAGDGGTRGGARRRRREQSRALGEAARHVQCPSGAVGDLTRRGTAGNARRAGQARARAAAGHRGRLASGLLPASDRPHLLRLQGWDRPAGSRRESRSAFEPEGAADQGRGDHPRLPR